MTKEALIQSIWGYCKHTHNDQDHKDLQEFSDLIDQKLTEKTKSAWHPKLLKDLILKKRYKSES